jgi:hypothetical protein
MIVVMSMNGMIKQDIGLRPHFFPGGASNDSEWRLAA